MHFHRHIVARYILDILNTITWNSQDVATFIASLKPFLISEKAKIDEQITEKEEQCTKTTTSLPSAQFGTTRVEQTTAEKKTGHSTTKIPTTKVGTATREQTTDGETTDQPTTNIPTTKVGTTTVEP